MSHLNVEIKARCHHPDRVREYLLSRGADFRGLDEQTDTYFHSRQGRLKLREGRIENNLIYYERMDQAGPKQSHFRLVRVEDADGLKQALTSAMGIKVIVKKEREIYYIGNVKFHIDHVPGLGDFMEIEAGNLLADVSREELEEQCRHYLKEFGIAAGDLLERSYSDMLMGEEDAV